MNTRASNMKKTNILNLLLITTSEQNRQSENIVDLYLFLFRYSSLLNNTSEPQNSCDPKTSQFPTPQGNGEMGARYLDPKYSRWISTDPALGEYIPAAGKGNSENAGNLPGMGGIYNSVNGNLYHYAGNNPVRYVDPDGEKLYVCGSKEYMGAVQRELTKLCDGAIINFDTGEVTLSSFSKESNPKGYEILSNLIESPKINTICLGDSKNAGNSTINYNTIIFLKDGKFYRDKTNGAQNSLINFDPNNWDDGGVDDSGSTRRPSYVGLSHEMGHSEAINRGSQTYEDPIPMPKTTPKREENAMKRENQIRAEHNLTKRTWYYQSL